MRRFRHFLTCNKIHTLCYWLFTPSSNSQHCWWPPSYPTHGLPFWFSSSGLFLFRHVTPPFGTPLPPLYPERNTIMNSGLNWRRK